MNLDLTGQQALICGSSQGIGLAIAKQLAILGANCTLFARNSERLQQAIASLDNNQQQQHQYIVADFSQPQQVQSILQQHLTETKSSYSILINNTGGPSPGPVHQADISALRMGIEAHLITNQVLVQALLPQMQQQQYGRIINVISTSVKTPLPNLGVSNTVRGAIASWAKTLANELGKDQITVNNVLPGATKTARLDAILQNKAKQQQKPLTEVIKNEQQTIPLQRFAEPEEFAAAVAFLASPAASYITGINLPVDGGRTPSL